MARAAAALLAYASLVGAASRELTSESWDDAVAGKVVFVKFFAPWCGNCQEMKPHWDKVMAEFEQSSELLVAKVDCTAGGKAMCDRLGIIAYPTIKYGDPDDLQDYKGSRTFAPLKLFADSLTIAPVCGPAHPEVCSKAKREQIEEYKRLSQAEREALMREKLRSIDKIYDDFDAFVDDINRRLEEATEKKDRWIEANGPALIKAVDRFVKRKRAEL